MRRNRVKPKYQKPQLLMKSIKTLESINLEDVPGFNNNNKHYKKSSPTNPSLTDLGLYDLEIHTPHQEGPPMTMVMAFGH